MYKFANLIILIGYIAKIGYYIFRIKVYILFLASFSKICAFVLAFPTEWYCYLRSRCKTCEIDLR